MNALHESARGRTKAHIAGIRHIYLDFDENGAGAVQALLGREDLPTPSFTLHTSPDKRQVIWKVDAFGKQGAEDLQRHLARDLSADPAATDCARVLRLPGFYNHKYGQPHLVEMEVHSAITGEIYQPKDFPKFPSLEKYDRTPDQDLSPKRAVSGLSQSERDWAYAKRALARGDPEERVVAAIAKHRRYDKHDPLYYAGLTVKNALVSLDAQRDSSQSLADSPMDR